MALRLRRGTDTERQLITPVLGELIYTTDTKEVYVGDGFTVGGVPVDKEVLLYTSDLLDVDDTPAADGNVLVWSDVSASWEPRALDILFDLTSIDALDDVDTTTSPPMDGSILAWDNVATVWAPTDINLLINEISIDNLIDVDTSATSPNVGDVLAWDPIESLWANTNIELILDDVSISSLLDVDTVTVAPSEGDILAWDVASSSWITGSISTLLDNVSISAINDVDTETDPPVDGSLLAWDVSTSNWITTELDLLLNDISIAELSDVDTMSVAPEAGDLLTWEPVAGNWVVASAGSILSVNSISQLADVDTISEEPLDNDLLAWDAATETWRVSRIAETLANAALGDLGDINTSAVMEGDVLTWDSIEGLWLPKAGIVESGNYSINIVGADSTIIVNSETNEHVGSFDGQFYGDLQGNVFAADSSIMVDWLSNTLTGSLVTGSIFAETNYIGILPDPNALAGDTVELRLTSIDAPSFIRLSNDTSNPGIFEDGTISFSRIDNGVVSTSSNITSTPSELIITHSDGVGNFPLSNIVALTEAGNLVIGGLSGSEKLNVEGNAAINGNAVATGFVQFGSFTTTERNALTAQNGMVLYNTTAGRFQGYQAGAWINLDDGTAA